MTADGAPEQPGEIGRAIRAIDEVRACVDDLEPAVLVAHDELDEALSELASACNSKLWSTHMLGKRRTP